MRADFENRGADVGAPEVSWAVALERNEDPAERVDDADVGSFLDRPAGARVLDAAEVHQFDVPSARRDEELPPVCQERSRAREDKNRNDRDLLHMPILVPEG